MVPPASAWSLRQSACCQLLAKIYQPLRKALSHMNASATVIFGTLGKHLNDCRIQYVPQWLRKQLIRLR